MEIQGKIKLIGEIKTFGSNGFRKRDLVIVTPEQYPQQLLIEFQQDKCELLNNYSPEDNVKIQIKLRGREWINSEGEAKYFNSIVAWRIEKLIEASSLPSDVPDPNSINHNTPSTPQNNTSTNEQQENEEEDDLPF